MRIEKIFDVQNCSDDRKISFATLYWKQRLIINGNNEKNFWRIDGKNDKDKFTNKNMIRNESESDNKRVKTFGFEMGSHHKRLNHV